MYYRVAIQAGDQAGWKWKSTNSQTRSILISNTQSWGLWEWKWEYDWPEISRREP